ncbi:MAG: M3 family oligoendopeptidase [Bacilli bacterium]
MVMKFSEYEYIPIDIEKVKDEFHKLIEKFKEAKTAKKQISIMKEIDDFRRDINTNFALCNVRFTINTADKYYAKENDKNDEIRPVIQSLTNEYYKVLKETPFKQEIIKKYGKNIFDIVDVSLKAFDPVIVEDMIEENKLSSQYTKLIASAKIKFNGQTYNLSSIGKFAQDSDRAIRAKVSKLVSKWFEKHCEEFDEIYDKMVHVRDKMAKKLGYENYVQFGYYRLGRVDYNANDVKGYREQVYKYLLPLTKKLFKKQAKRLGIKGMKSFDYNLEFLSGNPTPKGDKKYLVDQAINMYDEMSPETSEFFHFMVDSELLDLESKPNKAGGGYTTTLDRYHAPFIFANFNGTSGDVDVLTHEVGHAFMAYTCRDVDLLDYSWPTLEACEIHSMSMEFFTYPWMNNFFKEDTDKYKFTHLNSAITFIPYGVAVDEFQHFVYENVDVTPEQRRLKWREIEKKYLPHIKYNTKFMENGGRWFRQGHIFEAPFYYIDYTLAQVCAFQFFNLMNKDREKAWAKYVKLCKLGGSKSFLELLEVIKLKNPFVDGSIKKIVKPIKDYIATIDDTKM